MGGDDSFGRDVGKLSSDGRPSDESGGGAERSLAEGTGATGCDADNIGDGRSDGTETAGGDGWTG